MASPPSVGMPRPSVLVLTLSRNKPADSLPNMPVKLYVLDPKKDHEVVRDLQFSYNNSRHRSKMSKTTYWALNSGYAVEIIRVQDDAS